MVNLTKHYQTLLGFTNVGLSFKIRWCTNWPLDIETAVQIRDRSNSEFNCTPIDNHQTPCWFCK